MSLPKLRRARCRNAHIPRRKYRERRPTQLDNARDRPLDARLRACAANCRQSLRGVNRLTQRSVPDHRPTRDERKRLRAFLHKWREKHSLHRGRDCRHTPPGSDGVARNSRLRRGESTEGGRHCGGCSGCGLLSTPRFWARCSRKRDRRYAISPIPRFSN